MTEHKIRVVTFLLGVLASGLFLTWLYHLRSKWVQWYRISVLTDRRFTDQENLDCFSLLPPFNKMVRQVTKFNSRSVR